MLQWQKLADSITALFTEGKNLLTMEVSGTRVCVAKAGDQVHAVAATCPHAGALLSDGYVDLLGNIVCPMHHYKFLLRTGTDVSGGGYRLKTYPIENRADGIYIGLEIPGK